MRIPEAKSWMAVGISFCITGAPLQAALAPVAPAASVDTTQPMPSDDSSAAAATTNSTINSTDTPSQAKAGDLIMRGVDLPKTSISMDFQDADIRDVLHLLAVKSGLNIIYGADITGPISIHLDRVPFDQAFQTVLTLKSLVALPMGPRIIRVVSSTGLTTEQSQATTFTRVFRLNYANADDIKKPVDAIRTASGRKGVSTVESKTNSLIITDTQEGLKEVEDLIPTLDKKPQQVDIESKVVEVSLSNDLTTGISWQYAANLQTPNPGATTPSVSIGGSNLNTAATNGPGVFNGGSLVTPLTAGAGSNGGVAGTGVSLNSITNTGFSFVSRAGTYLLAAQIAALATQQRAKVLSSPHVVTMNNEEAKIDVAQQIPYPVTTTTNNTIQTTVQFVSAGVKLTVKPTINADRRITLKVKPEVSNALPGNVGDLPPTIQTRNAETTVVLRDGETIAIGGLITENTTKKVSGVPVLMSIPILGYLFKQTSDHKDRDELIVFLTPRIAAE